MDKRFRFNGCTNCIEYEDKSILLDSYGEEIEELLNELNDENTHIKNTIKEMYNNERTALGRSVLKQLLEAIQ